MILITELHNKYLKRDIPSSFCFAGERGEVFKIYYIYTDGSYKHKQKNPTATWSFAVCNEKHNLLELHTGTVEGTKQDTNTAELTAVIKAMEIMKKDKNYILYTDCEAIYNYCNGNLKPKKNLEFYQEISKLQKEKHVLVLKVKGHDTRDTPGKFNDLVDSLAKHTAKILINK